MDRIIGIPLVMALAAFRRRRTLPSHIRTVGLISLGAIGDTVLLTAIIADVRRALPGCRILLFVSHSNGGLAGLIPCIDEFVVMPILRPMACIRMLRSSGCDILVDFTQWPRLSAIYTALGGARWTAGFKTRSQFRDQAFDRAVEHRAACHELENFRALIRIAGIPTANVPAIRLPRTAAASVASEISGDYVVFHPWASGFKGWLREWTTSGYLEVARAVNAQGLRVVVTGSPDDAGKADALAAEAGRRGISMIPVAGRFSLAETAALLSQARLVVAVSTGILHLAAALDVKLVGLYGPTNPALWGPVSDSAIVVVPRETEAGYLYLGFEYPKAAVNCTAAISAREVVAAVLNLLARTPGMSQRESAEPRPSRAHALRGV